MALKDGLSIVSKMEEIKDVKTENKYIICSRCKKEQPDNMFKIRKNGIRNKMCGVCLDKAKAYNNKYKCIHGRRPTMCKDCGTYYCLLHNKRISECFSCGGASLCIHGRNKNICKESECIDKATGICEHKKKRQICDLCDAVGYFTAAVRSNISGAFKRNKNKFIKDNHSLEYLGIGIRDYIEYITNHTEFRPEFNMENYGSVWHIDHIVPLYFKRDGVPISKEVIAARCHYLNTQPMLATENISKGNKYCGPYVAAGLPIPAYTGVYPEDRI